MQTSLSSLARLLIPPRILAPAGAPLPNAHPTARPVMPRAILARLAARLCRQVTLGPGDTGRIIAHYQTLSAEDRIARFHGLMTPQAIAARYQNLDWGRSRFIALTFPGRAVALAEIADFTDPETPGCEIAVSVLQDWQGLHLGERVMRAAVQDVCGRHHVPAHVLTRRDNIRFIRLAAKLGARGHMEDGQYDAVFAPA